MLCGDRGQNMATRGEGMSKVYCEGVIPSSCAFLAFNQLE